MPIRDDLNLARMETVIAGAIEAHFAGSVNVAWAYQNQPRPPLPLVVLNLLSPPRKLHTAAKQVASLPRVVDVRFVTGGPGATSRLFRVNGRIFPATGTSPGELRDSAIAAITAAAAYLPVTPSAQTADTMRLTAVGLGDLEDVRLPPDPTVDANGDPDPHTTVTVVDREDVLVLRQRQRALMSVNVHAATPIGSSSARVIMSDVLGLFVEPDFVDALRYERIGMTSIGTPRDLSAVEGSELEARLQADIGLLLTFRRAVACPPIESVELHDHVAGPQTFTVSLP